MANASQTPIVLSNATLSQLDARVSVPKYDRSKVKSGIIHFGVGGFHRSHEAMYIHELMQKGEALDWGITGVGLLSFDERMSQVMTKQDCLYTLIVKEASGATQIHGVGSIIDYIYAPHHPQRLIDALASPDCRIVSLTITEGGYLVNQSTGEFDPSSDKAIQADLQPNAPHPTTAFGYIVDALARRRAAGTPPFVVMSCDNIDSNGHLAHRMIVAFARLKNPELAAWIDANVSFPNSMVDRITPVTTDTVRRELTTEYGLIDEWPVACEPFSQWVLEDAFNTSSRPQLEHAGVQLVKDVQPYELMKLRLLNACHQAMCYLAFLAGLSHVHDAASDTLFARFLLGYMNDEASPTLSPVLGVDLDAYKRNIITRFANPRIADTIARLCAESSDRVPKFVLPVIHHQVKVNGPVRRGALIIAAWARYAEGVDEKGVEYKVIDRRSTTLCQRAQTQKGDDRLAFLRDETIFGDLAKQEHFTKEYTRALDSLHKHGARTTLQEWEKMK